MNGPSSVEARFVVSALRRFLRPEVPVVVSRGLNWRAIQELAVQHSVAPPVYLAAREADAPREVLDALRRYSMIAIRQNAALGKELGRLFTLFREERLNAVALKGPALAAFLYGENALRHSSDLDILVRVQDLPRVRRLLEKQGYQLVTALHWPTESAMLRAAGKQVKFERGPGGICVDLHWDLTPPYFPRTFEPEEVWGALKHVNIDGAEVAVLSPYHQLLYLCAHGARHAWYQLNWVCDTARLLQVAADLDWDRVFQSAHRTRTERVFATGLLLVQELLEDATPAPAARFAASIPGAGRFAQDVWQRFDAQAQGRKGRTGMRYYALRILSDPAQRFRFVCNIRLRPHEADFRLIQLPPRAFFLYHLFHLPYLYFRKARYKLTGKI